MTHRRVPERALSESLLGCVLGPASADIRRGAEAASFLKPIPAAWGERQEPVVIRLHHQKSLLVHRPVSSFGIALRTDWRVQGESHLGSVATKRLPSFKTVAADGSRGYWILDPNHDRTGGA